MQIEYTLEDVISRYTSHITNTEEVIYSTNLMLGILLLNTQSWFFIGTETILQEDDIECTTEKSIAIYVNANDIFAWGCADQEGITLKELPEFFLQWHIDKDWGIIKWLCTKRNKRPQPCIIKEMKEEGAWCELMENLPE